MAARRTIVISVVVAAFVGVLLYGTLGSQQVECRITVAYDGKENTASASAANEEDAEHQAKVTACGPIAPGMDPSIQCTNRPPVTRDCHSL